MNKELYVYPGVTSEQLQALKDRVYDFMALGTQDIKNTNIEITEDDKVLIKEGTLLHGTTFDKEKLKSIAVNGIITKEFFGYKEEGGTYYHAEFYRANKDMSLKEFVSDERPLFPKKDNTVVGIVIVPNKDLTNLFLSDSLSDNSIVEEDVKSLVDAGKVYHEEELKNNTVSAIPIGIPSNCFSALVIGHKIKKTKSKVDFLKKMFPNLYIVDVSGKIIERPSERHE